MRLRNSPARYGAVAASLHWIIVAGVIAQYFLAEAAEDESVTLAGGATPLSLHMSIGITLLALAIVRLVWRSLEPPPAWPATMKRYETWLAKAVHATFYVLLFVIPISGWMLASAEGESLRYFGLFDLPALGAGGGESREELLAEVHEVLFNALVVLALVHVAAALKHHLFDHDGVLRSMLPGRR